MNNSITLLIVLFSFSSIESLAQQEESWEIARKERAAFANTLDSLFLQNEYSQIIKICSQPSNAQSSACIYNLIGTYYSLGDSTKSMELLNQQIISRMASPDFDAYSLDILLAEDYTAYRKFLQQSTAKDYILGVIDSLYLTEPVSDKANGLQLVHLLVEDQWIRNTSSLYDHFKPERRHLLPSQMDSTQAIQAQYDHCTEVFHFYKKHNKVFSKEEVGRAYYWQMLLFFHESNLERRSFYHQLLIQGVENGAFKPENLANFEGGTQYFILGVDEFFKQRTKLEESYKIKYSLPDSYRLMLL